MDAEKIIELFRAVVADTLFDVHAIGDIVDDKQRAALLKAIVTRLNELGVTIEEIIPREIANQYAGGLAEAERLILEVSKMAETDLKAVNKRIHIEAVDVLVSDTMQDLTAAIRTAGENATRLIEDVVKQEIGKGLVVGNDSRRVGAIVAEEFRNRGLTSFTTSDGKELPLHFYASTVVRTKMKQAHTDGAVNRYKENGVELVQINEHHPTCHVCAARNGLVVSIGPNDQGYPTAAETGLPPFHPNCRHSIRPYMSDFKTKTEIKQDKKEFKPDKDPRSDAQKEAYQTEQAIRRKAAQERKEYERMKAALGDGAPKTLGAYRRMKRKKDEKWKELQERFKTAIDKTDAEREAGPKPKNPRKPRTPKAPATPPTPPPAPAAPPAAPGEFKKAITKAEAETWAKQNLKHVQTVDYSKYDLELANEVNRQMQKLQERYPEATTKYLGSNQTRNSTFYAILIQEVTDQLIARGYSRAEAARWAKKKVPRLTTNKNTIATSTDHTWREFEGICFNDAFAKNYKDLDDSMKRMVSGRWAPEGSEDPISIFTHEFGHQIDNFLGRTDKAMRRHVIEEPYRDWINEARKQAQKNPLVDWRKNTLSEYGKKNDSEFFAEAFREYIHNPNPRPIAAEVGRRLEETMKKWRANNGTA